VQAALVADLKNEVNLLRKQLHLYRLEGAPRDWRETVLAQPPPTPSAAAHAASPADAARSLSTVRAASIAPNGLARTSTLAPPSPSNAGADERRRIRERERELRMEEAKQNALGGSSSFDLPRSPSVRAGHDPHLTGQRPPALFKVPSAAVPTITVVPASPSRLHSRLAPAHLSVHAPTGSDSDGETPEPRFTAPISLNSPSNRIALGRPFGGAGSEKLELSLSGSLARSPLNRAGSRSRLGAEHDEGDDLVGALNAGARRPSVDRRPSASANSEHAFLGATQEFSVNVNYEVSP
jgi:hypothetical protein